MVPASESWKSNLRPVSTYQPDIIVSKELLTYLLGRDNSHVSHRINKLGLAKNQNATNTTKLKILKFISTLRNLYMFLTHKDSRVLLEFGKEDEIRRRLHINSELLTILLKKYTETIGGPSAPGVNEDKEDFIPRRRASPHNLARLLNYMAILCLFVEENWQVDVFYLKDDLGLQTREYVSHPNPLLPHIFIYSGIN